MKKIRTKRFFKALYLSMGFSAVFLVWMATFGRGLAAYYFDSITYSVFALLAIATLFFVVFCFVPYFRGDRRWFAIPSILTLAFVVGTAILWQVPTVGMAV
ncbi:MAG: hypothetical protein IJX80_08515 [Clostridia bacterium]|nr:hypothetical protein [Clostridia bacterium]